MIFRIARMCTSPSTKHGKSRRDYAAMMRGVLNGYKTTAEAQPKDWQFR